jgi:hypothetical protein
MAGALKIPKYIKSPSQIYSSDNVNSFQGLSSLLVFFILA